ncbi:hypothetical protein EOL96_09210 [Candidatus Saccharibacteria bacterium]|nr:hypothetical protein [Candidatus Saccharibacteria bacterium]
MKETLTATKDSTPEAEQGNAYDSSAEDSAATKARERQEFRDGAKEKARFFGRAALHRLQRAGKITAEAGLIGLGVGLIAGEASIRGAKATKEVATSVAHAGMNKAEEVTGMVGSTIEAGLESATNWKNEKIDQAREAYTTRRDAAKARILARRERQAAKRTELARKIRGGYERGKARIDVARGVGSVVVSHLSDVYGSLKDTKNVAQSAKADLEGSRQL